MRILVIAVAILAVDLATKTLAQAGMLAAGWIEATSNPDLALGVAGAPAGAELVLGFATLLVAILLLGRLRRDPGATAAAAFVIGGSLGNLADRLLLGSVRDFIVGPFIVFNVADVALLVGLLAVLARARHPSCILPASRPA